MSKQPEWFKHWLNNHWRHMTWKVNGLIAGMIIIIGLLAALFSAALTQLFG